MKDVTTWRVILEFRLEAPSFEIVVDAPTKDKAVRIAQEAACCAGWAECELRRVVVWPVLPLREVA